MRKLSRFEETVVVICSLWIASVLLLGCFKNEYKVESTYNSPIGKDQNFTMSTRIQGFGTNKEMQILHEKVVKFLSDEFIRK